MQNDTPNPDDLPLTDSEVLTMRALRGLEDENIALVRVRFEGQLAAAVVAVGERDPEDNSQEIRLLALLVNDILLNRITDLEGNSPQPLDTPDT